VPASRSWSSALGPLAERDVAAEATRASTSGNVVCLEIRILDELRKTRIKRMRSGCSMQLQSIRVFFFLLARMHGKPRAEQRRNRSAVFFSTYYQRYTERPRQLCSFAWMAYPLSKDGYFTHTSKRARATHVLYFLINAYTVNHISIPSYLKVSHFKENENTK
jgi:hypothetical protein